MSQTPSSSNPARAAILARLRAAHDLPAESARQEMHAVAHAAAQAQWAAHQTRFPAPRTALPERLAQALQADRAQVWRCSAQDWAVHAAQALQAAGIGQLCLEAQCPESQALRAALQALPDQETTPAPHCCFFDQPLEVFKPRLFNQIDAGFTVAQAALADTGTLILRPHPGAPRSLSLVPPLHVALVWSDTLYPSLPVALQAERWTEGLPGNVVLISSPSKTSDIQQTLAFGAHGPRALWVFIVEREAA